MQEHSTKIFRDIISALGSFLQSLFTGQSPSSPTSASTSSTSSTTSSGSTGGAGGAGTTPGGMVTSPTHGPRRGFMSGNVFISYFALPASGTAKPIMYLFWVCPVGLI